MILKARCQQKFVPFTAEPSQSSAQTVGNWTTGVLAVRRAVWGINVFAATRVPLKHTSAIPVVKYLRKNNIELSTGYRCGNYLSKPCRINIWIL